MSLRDALLAAKVASAAHLDEAVARQHLYGSDVVTNLLELVTIRESDAHEALAAHYALPPAPAGELPYASAAALELVPREVAKELGIYPYRFNNEALTVIASEPLADQAILDLGFTLHTEIETLFALAPRIRQAIVRDYAFALDRRTAKTVARLTYGNTTEATEPPPTVAGARSFSQFPRPRSSPPFGFPDQWSDAVTPSGSALLAETARQPTVAASRLDDDGSRPQTSRALLLGRAPSRHDRPVPTSTRKRGPYTLAALGKDLEGQRDADDVLTVYFDFASQFFDYTALMTIQPDSAKVRHAHGTGAPVHEAGGHRLLLSDYPLLAEIRVEGRWRLLSLANAEPKLADLLNRKASANSLLLPLKVRSKVLLVLYGGFDEAAVTLEALGELVAAEPFVAQAFERAIRLRKAPSVPIGELVSPQPRRRHPLSPVAERARALAGVIEAADPKK